MNNYKLTISETAEKQLENYKKTGNIVSYNKIKKMLIEITVNPYKGTGKPEALKYNLQGLWSRRINQEDRMIYKVEEEFVKVLIISLKGHYY
jgi:toxin YoeB